MPVAFDSLCCQVTPAVTEAGRLTVTKCSAFSSCLVSVRSSNSALPVAARSEIPNILRHLEQQIQLYVVPSVLKNYLKLAD